MNSRQSACFKEETLNVNLKSHEKSLTLISLAAVKLLTKGFWNACWLAASNAPSSWTSGSFTTAASRQLAIGGRYRKQSGLGKCFICCYSFCTAAIWNFFKTEDSFLVDLSEPLSRVIMILGCTLSCALYYLLYKYTLKKMSYSNHFILLTVIRFLTSVTFAVISNSSVIQT